MNEAAFKEGNRIPSKFDLNCKSLKISRANDYARLACYDETPPDLQTSIPTKTVVIFNIRILEEDIQIINEYYFELQAVHGHTIGNQLHIFL